MRYTTLTILFYLFSFYPSYCSSSATKQKQAPFLLHLMEYSCKKQEMLHLIHYLTALWDINVNEQDPYDNRTPLHLAVLQDNQELVKRLMTLGADPSLKDIFQATPINYAASQKMRLLLKPE